jgi:hypothetical protein
MSFVDAINQRGEVQAVPAHYLEAFPDQFKPVDSAKSPAPAKAEKTKEA